VEGQELEGQNIVLARIGIRCGAKENVRDGGVTGWKTRQTQRPLQSF
jgi:hypothetical protein